jgi:hypothetical protein
MSHNKEITAVWTVKHEWVESRLVPEEKSQEEKACYMKDQQEQHNNNNTNTTRFLCLIISICDKHIVKQYRFSINIPISLQTESAIGGRLAENCCGILINIEQNKISVLGSQGTNVCSFIKGRTEYKPTCLSDSSWRIRRAISGELKL